MQWVISTLPVAKNIQSDPGTAHYNLTSTIHHVQSQIPLQLKFEHDVKGHQDMGQSTVLLHTSWMNIEMDALGKWQAKTPFQGLTKYKRPHEG